MKIINEVKISFMSVSANERFSRIAVAGVVSQLDPRVTETAKELDMTQVQVSRREKNFCYK